MQPEIQTITSYRSAGRVDGYQAFRFAKRVALPEAPTDRGTPRELTVEVWRRSGNRTTNGKDFLDVVARVEECTGTVRIWCGGDFYRIVNQVYPSRITKAAITKLFDEVATDERVRELAAEAVTFYQARQVA